MVVASTAFSLVPLATAAASRALDAHTIEQVGVPGIDLMENAGREVAREALVVAPRGRVLVVCGPGNNGGDGYVVARVLAEQGRDVTLLALRAVDALGGDARLAAERLLSFMGSHRADRLRLEVLTDLAPLERALVDGELGLVVDALFGTGLTRPLEGLAADVVGALADAPCPVLAVDLPSGLPTDGAAPGGPHVVADRTVTFGGLKIAHRTEPSALACGSVRVADIGLVAPRDASLPDVLSLESAAPARLLDVDASAHKGTFGHVGVLAGSPETRGAAELAAYAALRAGAGLCTLLCDEGDEPSALLPEVMRRSLTVGAPDLQRLDAVVVGPGLGRSERALARGRAVLKAAAAAGIPTVVDADGLVLLAEVAPPRSVITPHPGEAARLLSSSTAAIQGSRIEAARALRERIAPPRSTVVLKGAYPLVARRTGDVVTVPGGNLALAVGGSGDVLAGMIGALLARGLGPDDAALLGVWAHQRAGADLGARRSRGFLAREIADAAADALFGGTR